MLTAHSAKQLETFVRVEAHNRSELLDIVPSFRGIIFEAEVSCIFRTPVSIIIGDYMNLGRWIWWRLPKSWWGIRNLDATRWSMWWWNNIPQCEIRWKILNLKNSTCNDVWSLNAFIFYAFIGEIYGILHSF